MPALEWRRIGPLALDLGLASPASGPVDRVWYSAAGDRLFARTASGTVYFTRDFENWQAASSDRLEPPAPSAAASLRKPEPSAVIADVPFERGRLYAAGAYVYRSDDGGATWTNLTAYRSESIVGDRLTDIAVSPNDGDELTVAGAAGVWRSVDGGTTWTGLNDNLPNLPARRLLAAGGARVRIGAGAGEFDWRPGVQGGWLTAGSATLSAEADRMRAAAAATGSEVTALVTAGDTTYAGAADGRLFVTTGTAQTWRPFDAPGGARIERIAADPAYASFAVAITAARGRGRVLRTTNGGVFWDDITANLPTGTTVRGVAVDRATGAVYVATSSGVFLAYTETVASAPPLPWTLIREGAAEDVMLDAAGNQIYVAAAGPGVYASLAPHRLRDPKVVSAADRVMRAAAPGALLSVLGARVESLRAGDQVAPVLAAADSASEVQLPFELTGSQVVLSVNSGAGAFQIGLPLLDASPAIFVDPDGNPVVMNADSGLMIDPGTAVRPGMRLHVLAAGLGRVTPAWPAGLAAPLEDTPRVVAAVRAYLDGEPVEVTRATLAPGYVGLYLIEVRIPALLNRGSADLHVEAGNVSSNRVRLYLEP